MRRRKRYAQKAKILKIMLTPFYTSQFKKDFKHQERRNKNIQSLEEIITFLISEKGLSHQYRDHPLKGKFKNFRECHIESDWLLIYKQEGDNIYFIRTGTHSDLFE